MKKILLVSLLIVVMIAAAGYAWSQKASSAVNNLDLQGIDISSKDGKTVVNFTTDQPGFCQVLIGTEKGKYDRVAVESMPVGAHQKHYNVIDGLKPDTQYMYRINFNTADGQLFQSKESSFQTAKNITDNQKNAQAEKPDGLNIALSKNGGRILGVSSNYGNAANNEQWGAEKAIDGDSATEWSSNDEGNKAWIEIGFDQTYQVKTIGFWTRTMGTTAEIKQFRVLSADGKKLGLFSLQGSKQIQYFTLDQPISTNALRFEAVDSSGGNTGAVEIEAYAKE